MVQRFGFGSGIFLGSLKSRIQGFGPVRFDDWFGFFGALKFVMLGVGVLSQSLGTWIWAC